MTDINDWLENIGLGKYGPLFAEHEITVEVLPDLTAADVDRLALPTGPRRRLLVAIKSLSSPSPAQPSVPPGDQPKGSAGAHDAERRQLTVMFCDVVGSTAMAERLDPEELRELMQAYRRVGGDVVARYDGHVAQYLGDGLMVYFGWPIAHEDDAERGVRAALEIVQAVKGVSLTHPLAVRIGVATGTVVVGEASRAANAEARLAVGETPALAARLQGLAESDEVVIAPTTRRLVGDAFELTDLGERALKGITAPVRAWRVDSLRQTEGRFEAAHGRSVLTPLVGRDEEVMLLRQLWRHARSGEGRAVLVGGEAGIGKSRLTQVLLEQTVGEECAILRFQCSPYHLNSALYPFTVELEVTAGFSREDGPDQKLDKIEAVMGGGDHHTSTSAPLVAALLSLPTARYPALKLSPQRRKEETLEALVARVEALARRQPVLMLFEDAHWIDPTSQELLDILAPRLQGLAVLLVVTHRPEYPPQWVQHAHVTLLGLGRLGQSQGAELVAGVTGGRGIPAEVLKQILAHTDGVPLFVEELTKSVLESGLLRDIGDAYTLESPLPHLAIPTSLRDSLLARLDRLAPVKDIIQIGACIGREFSYELLARIAAPSDQQLEVRLQTLTEAGMVYRRGTPPDATYTFKHALVQDAAYDSLLKTSRHLLHAQIARVLEADFADQVTNEPELLAHHYTQAGNLAAAVPWWRNAGQRAVQRFGVREALVHFQKGLTLLEHVPPSAERDELELSIREPLNASWTGLRGWAAAEVSVNALAILELTKRLGKTQRAGTGLWAIWVNTTTNGRIADSLEWAQRLLAEGEQTGEIDSQILGHGASMIAHFYLGSLLEARKHGDRILALYDPQLADRWMQVTAHDMKTLVGVWSCQWTWMLGYPDEAVRLSDEKDVHARRMGDAFNLGFALTLGAYAFDYRNEPEKLLERVQELNDVLHERPVPLMDQVMVPQVEGLARLRSGDYSQATASLRLGLDNWKARGGHSRVPYLKSALAEALALDGNLDEAIELIDECLVQIERPGWQERSHLAEVLRLKGWMLMQQDRDLEAEPLLRAAIDWARQQEAKSWELRASTTLAQLLVARNQGAEACALLAPVYDWFTEGLETHDLKAAREILAQLR